MKPAAHVAFFLLHDRWPTPQELHHCDNPACARGEHVDNMRDRARKGRYAQGVACPRTKLSSVDVEDIRSSKESLSEAARRYDVATSTISRIRNHKMRKVA